MKIGPSLYMMASLVTSYNLAVPRRMDEGYHPSLIVHCDLWKNPAMSSAGRPTDFRAAPVAIPLSSNEVQSNQSGAIIFVHVSWGAEYLRALLHED